MEDLYIHLDTTSNYINTKGLDLEDFCDSIVQQPENILLLNPAATVGEFESRTYLHMIRGREEVQAYFTSIKKKKHQVVKWIDFSDRQMLKELTPVEISELLYFGHMRTHLHSPFFYKLQNNYVFLQDEYHNTKIYFRNVQEIYGLLGDKLGKLLKQKVNERRSIFRSPTEVVPVPLELLRGLKPILQEGVIFRFSQMDQENYLIAVYVVEDRLNDFAKEKDIAKLNAANLYYNVPEKSWRCEHDQEYFAMLQPLKQA